MIEINLLPESMRKAEATPLPRFVALCLCVLIFFSILAVNMNFMLKIVPDAKKALDDKQKLKSDKEVAAAELQKLQKEISSIEEHVSTVRTLYKNRRVWAKLLYDIKQIVTYEPTTNESNTQLRYLWINSIAYSKGAQERIVLSGYATANNDEVSSQRLFNSFYERLLRYKNEKKPVEQEKERISGLMKDLQAKMEKEQEKWNLLRKQNPGLAATNPAIDEIKKEIEAYKKELDALGENESGRVALQPFAKSFADNGIVLDSIAWQGSPGKGSLGGEAQNLPDKVQQFKITCTFKQDESETQKRRR